MKRSSSDSIITIGSRVKPLRITKVARRRSPTGPMRWERVPSYLFIHCNSFSMTTQVKNQIIVDDNRLSSIKCKINYNLRLQIVPDFFIWPKFTAEKKVLQQIDWTKWADMVEFLHAWVKYDCHETLNHEHEIIMVHLWRNSLQIRDHPIHW